MSVRVEWMAEAPCADQPHLFGSKALCGTCPVQGLCLEHGLNEPDGVWGGLGPTARKRLRKSLQATFGESRTTT